MMSGAEIPPTPPDGLPPRGISRLYARIRSGKAFAIGLAAFIAIWAIANITPGVPHWDPDFGMINFLLSTEASLSQAVTYAGLVAMLGLILRLVRDIERMMRLLLPAMEAVRDGLDLLARDGEGEGDAGDGLGGAGPPPPPPPRLIKPKDTPFRRL